MKKIILLILILAQSAAAQVEYSHGRNNPAGLNSFLVDYAGYKSEVPGKTRIDVFVQVPYSNISFIKKDNEFHGGFNVTLTFMDEGKNNIIFERNWKERVSTNEFSQTLSRSNFFITYKSYDIAPGKYVVKSIVEDSDSRRLTSKEFAITAREIPPAYGLSDIMIISEIIKEPGGEKIIPNVSKSLTNKDKSLSFMFDLYSETKKDVVVEYVFNDLKKEVSLKQEDPRTIMAGTNTITHTINNINFSVGEYILTVILKDLDRKEITSAEKRISSQIAGIPSTIIDMDKAVNEMMYIASPDELEYIKSAKDYDEKMNRFMAFWDKRKPNQKSDDNPILYEYYRRIEYANKNFKGLGEGWRSDMGMIYVTFGPPNAVERHPLDMNSKPYEIWDYNELNKSFVFLDQTGFGDYRLVDPDYSRWPGYRH